MRVLVVEPDERAAKALDRGLRQQGYAVDLVGVGEEGVWYALERSYDVILLAISVPDLGGVEVCRRVRAAGRWSPVLMIDDRNDVNARVLSLDSGADDVLPRPFEMVELFARVRALTRRDPGVRPVVLEAGDLFLDPATRAVRRGAVEIDLSPKEFALLEELMRRPGDALSRTHLIEHVWDFAYDGTSNVVDVYIRYLRDKVDRPFGRATIQTVRAIGYRLDPAR